MQAQMLVEPFIVMNRTGVWLLEGPLGLSYRRYACFSAADICEILRLMAEMDLVDSELYKRVGPLTHTISRSHTLEFKGESWFGPSGGEKIVWHISLSSDWNTLPHLEIAESIRSKEHDIRSDGVQVWPQSQTINGEFKGNLISIIREVDP